MHKQKNVAFEAYNATAVVRYNFVFILLKIIIIFRVHSDSAFE